jgi:microcystin-dependent protein
MAITPFIGEVVMYAFNYPPKTWALCNGQFLPINQNQALFSILGTTYGGNGQTTFALPDLRGKVAMHTGSGHTLGEAGGQEVHTITMSEMPQHFHFMQAFNGNADSGAAAVPPTNNSFANNNFAVPAGGGSTPVNRYSNAAPTGTLLPAAITNTGGSQPHENRQPYTVISFCIALQGVFPSRN